MDAGVRSAASSGVVVKNRNSSGCLIVKRKGDVVGSSSSGKIFDSKEKNRASMVMSNSVPIDELLLPPRRRVGPETIRACNGLTACEKRTKEESEFRRKRYRFDRLSCNEGGLIGADDLEERERKRTNLDMFECSKYDSIYGARMHRKHFDVTRVDFDERRFMGSTRSAIEGEFETGLSRSIHNKRKISYHDGASDLNMVDDVNYSRFKMSRDGSHRPLSLLGEKHVGFSEESIRIQGKNGVLKVRVNRKMGSPLNNFNNHRAVERRQSFRTEDTTKRNLPIHPWSSSETNLVASPGLVVGTEKNKGTLRKSLSRSSENSDTSLNLGSKNVEALNSMKRAVSDDEQIPLREKPLTARVNEGKIRRGSGTEKQKLRERIRGMLLDAGWTIDYRPRRNRDYLDAVYINPGGTAYWSIIKAYEAFQKQLNGDDNDTKPSGESSSFAPISNEVLSQLTRKTRKKIEKEMRRKQTDSSDSDSAKDGEVRRSVSPKHDIDSMGSDSHEEKLSSLVKQGDKSLKHLTVENGVSNLNSKHQKSAHHINDSTEKPPSGGGSQLVHQRKSNKHCKCTLLIRNKDLNLENDGFVPYTGKRTVLSWLIDSGTVQLGQKVQYCFRMQVMLEGWITRDGIHCGCCSKILTVFKFEIHAGSKVRQPFQNIYLDSGASLLQCQIDAWNRQESSECIDFHSVDIDDDPNDDICGICGDGGDLICCDGCPSTFHQSCLDLQMLPLREWYCPYCMCKFCGQARQTINLGDDSTSSTLHTCNLCEKKYHESCIPKMDALPVDSNFPCNSFCGQDCKELFQHLKVYLGAKHELGAGFSWSLIHRNDEDLGEGGRATSQWVECNSKLAVALSVMDECFLPVIDRRSGINTIHNVLYNSGSNFNRLNFSGFYTAILEKGDEVISAASIRFHGTKFAEMPVIGTQHVYRRQGMFRRLFSAIESALCSLKVERLVIPAIPELMHTWRVAFGFAPLEKSMKLEMQSMNMLVFPGLDMLQKQLVTQQKLDGNGTARGAELVANGDKQFIRVDVAYRFDMDSLGEQVLHRSNYVASHPDNGIKNKGVTSDSGSQNEGIFANDNSVLITSVDASHKHHHSILVEGTEYHSGGRIADSASERKFVSPSSTSRGTPKTENKLLMDSPNKDNLHSLTHSPDIQGDDNSLIIHLLDAPRQKLGVFAKRTASSESDSDTSTTESASDHRHQSSFTSNDAQETESTPLLNSHIVDNGQPCKEGDADDDNESS